MSEDTAGHSFYNISRHTLPPDPNRLFDTLNDLDDFEILDPVEMQEAAALLLSAGGHAQIHAAAAGRLSGSRALGEEDQDMFRDALTRFAQVYGFLSRSSSSPTSAWRVYSPLI